MIRFPVAIKVWGPYACFTRPEAKVERVSYEVPTPSACRGILEAVYWHPHLQWQIRDVAVLNPIRHFSILRNEVSTRMSEKSKDGIEIGENRSQRHTLGLKNVAYVIRADLGLPSEAPDGEYVKHREQFQRRVEKGQCYQRPYLGCREFAADFCKPDGSDTPIDTTADLGRMLFDVHFREDPGRKDIEFYVHGANGEKRLARGYAKSSYFDAYLERGILRARTGETVHDLSRLYAQGENE